MSDSIGELNEKAYYSAGGGSEPGLGPNFRAGARAVALHVLEIACPDSTILAAMKAGASFEEAVDRCVNQSELEACARCRAAPSEFGGLCGECDIENHGDPAELAILNEERRRLGRMRSHCPTMVGKSVCGLAFGHNGSCKAWSFDRPVIHLAVEEATERDPEQIRRAAELKREQARRAAWCMTCNGGHYPPGVICPTCRGSGVDPAKAAAAREAISRAAEPRRSKAVRCTPKATGTLVSNLSDTMAQYERDLAAERAGLPLGPMSVGRRQ